MLLDMHMSVDMDIRIMRGGGEFEYRGNAALREWSGCIDSVLHSLCSRSLSDSH